MRILYLTNHILPEDFKTLEQKAAIKPNPAGQNFHGKLIHALSGFAEIDVISLVPNHEGILSGGHRDGDEKLNYTYVCPDRNKYMRFLFTPKALAKAAKEKADVILYDSLNIHIAKAARAIAKNTGAKRVAICTDSPYNITGGNKSFAEKEISLSGDCDGYICLTSGLSRLYNKNNRPCIIKMGVAEELPKANIRTRPPYFYYGGALFVKDGTKALIDAFNETKPDYDLVIAGHGNYEGEVAEAAAANPRIIFLGQISKADNYEYEAGASLLVNPRLYRQDLDEVSIPSKVIEYLSTGAPIVSTKSEDLRSAFPDDVNWIEDGSDLSGFLKAHLDKDGKLIDLKPNNAKEKLMLALGINSIGKDITAFLRTLIQQ